MMLQQTTVKSAVPHYNEFLKRFPTIEQLADAPLDSVLGCWSGLGYYSRARNLHAAAVRIVRDHGGRFPRDLRQALELPGIGPYTAAAVLSISYDADLPVLDGNVSRVLARLHVVRGTLRSSRTRKRLETLARRWLDPDSPGDFNQAMMELGALVCTPRSPNCAACPLSTFCGAFRKGVTAAVPRVAASAPVRRESTGIAVIERNGAVLVGWRPRRTGALSGLWELPQSPLSAPRISVEDGRRELTRSLRTGVHAAARVTGYAGETRHAILNRRLRLLVFRATVPRSFRPAANLRWLDFHDLGTVGMSSMVRKSLRLCGLLAGGSPAV